MKVSTPQSVALEDGRVLVLWTENGTVHFNFLDAAGNMTIENRTLDGAMLSDCKPIQIDDQVVWYVTDGGSPIFYWLSLSDLKTLTVTDTLRMPEPDQDPVTRPDQDPVTKPDQGPVTTPDQDPVTNPGQDPVTTPVMPFEDVQAGKWYSDAIVWAVKNDITRGTGANIFSPNDVCTRAQVVTFLWRANGCPEPDSAVNPFGDVKPEAYYFKAVLWAVENGITNGIGAGTFCPDQPCTRAQVVTFLARAFIQHHGGDTVLPFTDVDMSAYYYCPLCWAFSAGITGGTSETSFSPNDPCTRAQIVTFLYRAYALYS